MASKEDTEDAGDLVQNNTHVDKSKTCAGKSKVATNAKKQPPPEKPESVWLRTKIILSFWAVILFLGFPVWWKTTSIYRARLPINEMLGWSEGTACKPVLPLEIWIITPSLPCQDAHHIVEIAQESTDRMSPLAQPVRYRLAKSRPIKDRSDQPFPGDSECFLKEYDPYSTRPALKLYFLPDENVQDMKLKMSFDPHDSRADILYGDTSTRALGEFAAEAVRDVFWEEWASIEYKLAAADSEEAKVIFDAQPEGIKSAVISRENRALKYASTYHLTFSLFTPSGSPSSWDVESALKSYIQPWLSAFSMISNFTLNTQIQPYSAYSPSIQPFKDPETNHTLLRREDLSAFINAAEWPLSPSIGFHGPTINFVLYVPSASEVPLTIASTNGGTSWLIPQWGGVTILNPPLLSNTVTGKPTVPQHLDLELLRPAFKTFTSQLLSLLGLPTTPQPSSNNPPHHVLPLPIRLQSLNRLQTLSLHLLARSTLGSLARLSISLPNIPIPATVATLVSNTISHVQATCHHFHHSNASADWNLALAHARMAWEDSEKAFFEKSMVGQVYFPDEHKVAVYLPLLGPVGVPLLVALGREVARFVAGLKKRRRGT